MVYQHVHLFILVKQSIQYLYKLTGVVAHLFKTLIPKRCIIDSTKYKSSFEEFHESLLKLFVRVFPIMTTVSHRLSYFNAAMCCTLFQLLVFYPNTVIENIIKCMKILYYFSFKFQGGVDICAHVHFSLGQWKIPLK